MRARDGESGELLEIRAANVVNATGVWAEQLTVQSAAAGSLGTDPPNHADADGARRAPLPHIRPSRGTHLVLDRADLPLTAGAIVPAGGGRTIFALPWLGRTLVGTTDRDYEGTLEHVPAPLEDVDYLLSAVNDFFGTALCTGDLAGAFAGARPLISSGDPKRSTDISRRAELYEADSGLLTITGGKLTTWRRMAKQTVDRLVERDARDAPCRTHEIPLGQAIDADELERVPGVADVSYGPLAARYGHAAHDVLALARERPELTQPIVPGHPDILAEAALAAQREQARSVGDVLFRRTRLALLAAGQLRAEPQRVARVTDVLAHALQWDSERTRAETERFYAEAEAEGIEALEPHAREVPAA